ncbi:alpha/beta fold hydrolase [Erythrobacter sp. HL-111]|uniref:alpha/beta fold hydrolase n=1 Tax=Erythrobacter sp. HL-111 TaxID=1798193 RepID=UPI0006DBACB8|nr:alpha/beta fold hydrolase [Erythrobacter sp. HL-111]KPP82463.1 MAG: putative hydrolases or acyltransferases (alpha/beta hydrolase superfamily) [Erythrobacteraceae bacterium HL-111]SDS84768.1 Pimeloyl-ACP methyl ester carboxylesterase [Erythrobacter sp. HL-111]
MPTITTPNTGIELFYEDHGDPAHPPVLLVMGLGAQLTLWPDEMVEALTGRGFRVIRFDNRDIGLSQKMEGEKAPKVVWQVLLTKLGFPPRVPYTLTDMADDAIGLLDALGIGRAHVVGGSMGGMIAQLMAVHHPERLLSLTSIFSTTGNPKLPKAEKEAMDALTAPLESLDEETVVAHGMRVQRAIGSPAFRPDDEALRERVLKSVRRSVYPPGLPRQLAAIIADGDRRERLSRITAPTLVLHGEADPLLKVEAGEDTAMAIPGARLVTIPGWGHDLPVELADRLADEIAAHARAAEPALA